MQDYEVEITFDDGVKEKVASGAEAGNLRTHWKSEEELIALKANNKILSLSEPLLYSATVSPIFLSSKEAMPIYRRSLCLLLAAECYKLFPHLRLIVGHSLNHGYYYTAENGKMSEEMLLRLEEAMRKAVAKKLEITSRFVSFEEALRIFEKLSLKETRSLLYYTSPEKVKINTLDGFSDIAFAPLCPNTGVLKTFALMKYDDGFLLRFPHTGEPEKLADFHDQPLLFSVYKKYKAWGKQLSVTSAAALNALIDTGRAEEFINITETLQQKCISDIASDIRSRGGVRMILIAGPSSSGKTTTAKKLSFELQALGYKVKVISLDNYYIGKDKTPVGDDGKPDFECLEALDISLLNENLLDLVSGKSVCIPSYDFVTSSPRFDKSGEMQLSDNEILILEGIHAINDRLTPLLPKSMKYKLYISALTQLNLDDHNRISTSDNRLIRRLVRDARFRAKSACETISMWESVKKGEELYIFPFQNSVDAILNTALDYELAVLKVYAEPLLRRVSPLDDEYALSSRLLAFLSNFSPIAPTAVPQLSILREFIGGSAFRY